MRPSAERAIATEPLPGEFWATAGLRERETFTDARPLVIYGQRSADDRLAFGGRGAPYHFGSRVQPAFDQNRLVFTALEQSLRSMFPNLHARIIQQQRRLARTNQRVNIMRVAGQPRHVA